MLLRSLRLWLALISKSQLQYFCDRQALCLGSRRRWPSRGLFRHLVASSHSLVSMPAHHIGFLRYSVLSTGPVLSLFLLLLAASCRPFFVMMKLVPMATDEAMARPSPIYLCVQPVSTLGCALVAAAAFRLLVLPEGPGWTRPESQPATSEMRVQRVTPTEWAQTRQTSKQCTHTSVLTLYVGSTPPPTPTSAISAQFSALERVPALLLCASLRLR